MLNGSSQFQKIFLEVEQEMGMSIKSDEKILVSTLHKCFSDFIFFFFFLFSRLKNMLPSKKDSIKECDTNSYNNSGSPDWLARKLFLSRLLPFPLISVRAHTLISRDFSRQITAIVFIAN